MTELTRLITRLERGIAKNASYVKTIRHPQLLVHSLKELNELIGNDKVKESVAKQITHLIMIRRRAAENTTIKEDEVMLNTVLYGPPGVGKTLIGAKLAKIWYSLGYLDGSRNSSNKQQGLGDILKDVLKDSGGLGSGSDDTMITYYIMFIFIMVFLTIVTLAWSFYTKFGGMIAAIIVGAMVIFVVIVGFWVSSSVSSNSNSISDKSQSNKNDFPTVVGAKNDKVKTTEKAALNMPTDEQVIKVVTRADFVGQYVGWTDKKTIKLLQDNLGKVVFVDEAYSLVTDMHDSFGMEALTAINLFLSQHPKEIIVIFAGYKDLMETGIFSVQPGLRRRFMWQLDCDGYTIEQMFDIFKQQLGKKGWGLVDDKATKELFLENDDAFPAYGGDTERLTFYAECEHSSDFIRDETGMSINLLAPHHVSKGIETLKDNNIQDNPQAESQNPLANMMKMFRGGKQPAPITRRAKRPVVEEVEILSEKSEAKSASFAEAKSPPRKNPVEVRSPVAKSPKSPKSPRSSRGKVEMKVTHDVIGEIVDQVTRTKPVYVDKTDVEVLEDSNLSLNKDPSDQELIKTIRDHFNDRAVL